MRYAALSYVWGKAHGTYDHFSGTPLDSNRKSFALPQSLPATISDSIEFYKQMRVDYLWVDAVCMNQNDNKVKKASIAKMDTIYMRAHFIIIAAAGKDAYAGLPGVRIGTREDMREVSSVSGVKLMPILPNFSHHLKESVWSTRGWTFQEGYVSPRCFFVTPKEVFFACYEVTDRESLHSFQTGLVRGLASSLMNTTSAIAAASRRLGPRTLVDIMSDYCTRDLTSQSDALNAISGILNYLSAQTPFSFHFGVPIENGDILGGLLWYHWSAAEPILRRPQFPTYSWIHWRHVPHFDHDVEDFDNYFATASLLNPEESLESTSDSARGLEYLGPSAILHLEWVEDGWEYCTRWVLDEVKHQGGRIHGGWWPATMTVLDD